MDGTGGDAVFLLFVAIACVLMLAGFWVRVFPPGGVDRGDHHITGADYEPSSYQALRNSGNLDSW